MTPTTNQGGDPTAADNGAQTPGSGQSEQFIVCIADMGDGTYQVYSQDSDDDQDDSQGGDQSGDDDQTQTADNVDDALQIAKSMLEQEQGEDAGGDENAMLSPDDAKTAWNQMAAKRDKKRAGGM